MLDLLPDAAAAHAPWLRSVLFGVMLFISIVWTGLFCVFAYSLIRFRAHRQVKPSATPRRVPLAFEASMFAIEIALLVFISFPFWRVYAVSLPESSSPLEVRIIAQQFVWNVH